MDSHNKKNLKKYKMDSNELSKRINQSENVGRNYFESVIPKLFSSVKKIKFSENQLERFDCIVVGLKVYMVEIKVRNIDSTKYDTIMIEPDKRNYLMSMVENGFTPLYVNFFNDGKCLVWDLIKVGKDFTSGIRTTNKVTVNPSAGKKEVNRLFLKTSDAISVDYKK